MSRPFRIEPRGFGGRLGRLIDRTRPLRFSFQGVSHVGFDGDTLASALLANGVRLIGRSPRKDRPRGFMGIGAEEPNGFVRLREAGILTQRRPATTVSLADGLTARVDDRPSKGKHENRSANREGSAAIPSALLDGTIDVMQRLGTLGRLFPDRMGRSRAASSLPDRHEHLRVSCDLLIAGGGMAGLAAALAASESGARVILAEQNAAFGGQADLFGGTIDGATQIAWIAKTAAQLAEADRTILLLRTGVTMLDRDRLAVLDEKRDDGSRIWFVRAKRVIVATGSLERPLVFAGNDRPGVMLARAARAYALRYSVAPGARGVVVTNNDDGYRTAELLKDSGVDVVKVADLRTGAESRAIDRVKTLGLPIRFGAGAVGIGTDAGGMSVTSVSIGDLLGKRRIGEISDVACDFVLMSGGDAPVARLYEQAGGELVFDPEIGTSRPAKAIDALAVIGAANGSFTFGAVLDEGYCAGERFARQTSGTVTSERKPSKIAEFEDAPPGSECRIPGPDASANGETHFVDFSNDVTAADLDRGFGDVHSNLSGPPMALGAIVGPRRPRPVRRMPLTDWHEANGAIFGTAAKIREPLAYPRAAETTAQAALREGKAARMAAGLLDLSTLGRIEITGPDAAGFLHDAFAVDMESLGVGHCRRVLLRDGQGRVLDDGVLLRLEEKRYLLTTSAIKAERTYAMLERRSQIRSSEGQVFLTSLGESLAHMALTGPRAGEILRRLGCGDIPGPQEIRAGRLYGFRVHILRTGATGAPSFEILVTASCAVSLWEALLEAGRDLGLAPVGAEAFSALRLEAGVFTIGREADGSLTAEALGAGRSVANGTATALVGLIVADGKRPLPVGTQIVSETKPWRVLGRVTSGHESPTFGRPLALALLEGGRERVGGIVSLIEPDGRSRWAHVRPPRFLDAWVPPLPEEPARSPAVVAPELDAPTSAGVPPLILPDAALPAGFRLRPIEGMSAIELRVALPDTALRTRVAAVLGAPLPAQPRSGATARDVSMLWLSIDRWLVLAPESKIERLAQALRAAIVDDAGSATHLGDAWIGLALSGARAEATLLTTSISDLTRLGFPAGLVRWFMLGPVKVLLRVRASEPAFAAELWVPRSYARWVADTLIETARTSDASSPGKLLLSA